MFSNAFAFNQDIGEWNVSSVESMNYIFDNTESFKQDLSLWQLYPNINLDPIKDYISDLSKDELIKVLEDRKPTLDGSAKENFEALKQYKQLVDRIQDYAVKNSIKLHDPT